MKISLLLTLLPALTSASFYTNNPNVFELNAANFDSVVLESNLTSLVEFYAPWCGHCQELKQDFAKTGKALKDIAIVGAVNCDEEQNRPLCSKYRVQGFPTLIGFRPPKYDLTKKQETKSGKKYGHATETYKGPRKAKNLIDFVTGRMKNYVKRIVTEDKLESWVQNGAKGSKGQDRLKMVVFTKKDKLSPLLKSIAIDHLEHLDISYFPIKSKTTFDKLADLGLQELEKAEIWVYPTANVEEGVKYEDDINKSDIAEFLKQFDATSSYVDAVLKKYKKLDRIISGKKPQSFKGRKDEL